MTKPSVVGDKPGVNQQIALNYDGKRVAVTGASGFLGSNLIERLKDVNCQIIRVARTATILPSSLGKAEVKDICGDVCDPKTWENILLLHEADIIFHFAAQTSVSVANENPLTDHKANVLPMIQALETCRSNRRHPSLVFAGTVTEAGIPASLPVDESHADKPITVYDLHKLIAEKYLEYYAQQGIVSGVVLRLANVYGPGPKSSSADRGILSMMIRKALRGEPLTIYGKGDCLRDYVYVQDVIQAFLMAGASVEQINGQHFVIGSGQAHTISEAFNLVAERVALKTSHQVPVSHIEPLQPLSPIESRNFIANSSRFTEATAWRASCFLAEGIDRTVEAYSSDWALSLEIPS